MSTHGRTQLPNEVRFRVARFSVASADQHSKISARAPRSGNAATLPTLQLASRQAGCATRPAFRHRKQAHERSARARLCHSSARAWRSARMKRSGAEQLLLIWSGCGGRLNGVAVATAKRRCSGDAPCHRMLGQGAASQAFASRAILQSYRLHWIGRSTGCNAAARPDCGLLHVFLHPGGTWPFGGRNARRRPKKAKKRPWKPNAIRIDACCCCVILEAANEFRIAAIPKRSPTPLHYPLVAGDGVAVCISATRRRL